MTANGAPSITIQNDSPDYLVLGNMTIPNIPGGDVLFTGPAQTGLTPVQHHAAGVGNINITSDFDCSSFVGGDCVGNSRTARRSCSPARSTTSAGSSTSPMTGARSSGWRRARPAGQPDRPARRGDHRAALRRPIPGRLAEPVQPVGELDDLAGGDPGAATVCDTTGCHQTNNGSTTPNADQALVWAINGYFDCGSCSNAELDDLAYHWGSGTDPTLGGVDSTDGNNYSDLFYGDCFPEEGTQGDSGNAGNCSQNGAKGDSLVTQYTQIDSDPEDPRAGGSPRQGYLPVLVGNATAGYGNSVVDQSYPTAIIANGSSAIYGNQVSITGSVIDLDTTITAGQPTSWSLLLPSTLGASISADQTFYNKYGGSEDFPLDVDSELGTSQVTAVYDAAIGQIVVSEVGAAAGGANVSLNGEIISTVQGSSINVTGGLGQVNIDNETGVQMEIQRIFTGASNATVTNVIDINDTLRNQQTVYVETPGAGTITYVGKLNDDIGCVEGTQGKNANGTTCGSQSTSGPSNSVLLTAKRRAVELGAGGEPEPERERGPGRQPLRLRHHGLDLHQQADLE